MKILYVPLNVYISIIDILSHLLAKDDNAEYVIAETIKYLNGLRLLNN